MIRYILRRLLLLIPVLILVSFMVFALMDLAPGDIMSGWDLEGLTVEEIAQLRADLGIDDPLLIRYGRYMSNLIQGDLGDGDFSGISVWYNFISRLPATLILAGATILIGVTIAIPLGIFAARRAGSLLDAGTTAFTMVGMSMPGFWQGILMMLLFSYVLEWLPPAGFNHGWRSVVLPASVAASTLLAMCARQTRSSMLEVLKSDFLRTARAKGVPEKVVIRKHALGNALIPVVTTIGMSIALAVSGTAVIEAVFAWPGVGRFIVESVGARDVTSTTGAVILITILYVIILLGVDIAYAFIDPRIRAQYTRSGRKSKKAAAAVAAAAKIADPRFNDLSSAPEADAESAAAEAPVMQAVTHEPEPQEEPEKAAPVRKDFVSFVTVTEEDFKLRMQEASTNAAAAVADGESAIRKHRKRSRSAEVVHHLLRNPSALAGIIIIGIMLILFVVALLMPWEAVTAANIPARNSPPSAQHWFGTDGMGRDLFNRVVYATRFSLPIGVGATAFGALFGVFLGALAAYYEGTAADEVMMRFSDALASIPGILIGMVIITALGRSVPNLIIAMGVSFIPGFMRIARASVLTLKGNEFVEAAKAIGLSNFKILFSQVLPNGLAPIIITFTASLGMAILVSAGLSFLGFGIPVPNPEWGSLVSAGRDNIRTMWWLTTFPGLFIMITVMGFNLLGDGLRDAFDPKLKR